MDTSTEAQVISVPEAGRMLGICRDSAYAAVRSGALPAIRLGRRIVISKAVVERMLYGASRSTGDTAKTAPREVRL